MANQVANARVVSQVGVFDGQRRQLILLTVQFPNQVLAKQSRGTEQGDAHSDIVTGNSTPKGAFDFGRVAASLKRYPDTNLLRPSRLRSLYSASQGVQDAGSADAETDHGGKGHEIERAARHSEVIREQRNHGTENAEGVKPEGRMNRKIAAKPNLEQQRGQPDRGHHHQSDRTEKRIGRGIDHDQGQS